MSRQAPYLQRRGDTLSFRIAVPGDLRALVGGRELTKTLRTPDKQIAIPMALRLAGRAKQIFLELRQSMSGGDNRETLRVDFGFEIELDELYGRPKKITVTDAKPGEEAAIAAVVSSAINGPASPPQVAAAPIPLPAPASAPEGPVTPPAKLSAVIADFLAQEGERDIDAMMKKHRFVMPMFLEVIGDKPIIAMKQSDITDFFKLVHRLPPHWRAIQKKRNLPIRKIAELEYDKLIAEDTFTGTYRACISSFLGWAKTNWQDKGFSTTLTVEKISYNGKRKSGTQQTQRALTQDELKRLYEGDEMRALADDPAHAERYWLPHVELFTGARVNEICQLNPQTDILQDAENGIWYFWINEKTEGDERIVKSVKTGEARTAPIHQKLIELGFLGYVERTKASGAKLLFPNWEPRGGRASPNAERWFNRFLRAIGIHGVLNEKGRAARGTHAFRHTLLTYGKLAGQNLRCVTGHKEKSDNVVADGYEDETILLPLTEKKARLDRLDFGLSFHRPAQG